MAFGNIFESHISNQFQSSTIVSILCKRSYDIQIHQSQQPCRNLARGRIRMPRGDNPYSVIGLTAVNNSPETYCFAILLYHA